MKTQALLCCVGTLCAMIALFAGRTVADALQKDEPKMKVATRIPLKAVGFELQEVRLLEGPFKQAQELDRSYLRSLDPDRLLHNFRVNAGLPSHARPLGGWEAPDCELRGHFVGHYLSACAQMVASTGDEELKQHADYVVAELAKCQHALNNGYLSAFPETFIDRVETLKPVWAPWYTLHKIFAGLQDMYVLCGNRQALEVAEKMADWTKRRADRLSDEQMQKMLGNEQGGMMETLANLYALTGRSDYLALAQRFDHHAVLDPLSRREDRLTGLHANTQIPKLIGAARLYELTGDEQMHTAADFFWNVVTKERSYVIGGDSDGEHFSPKEHLSRFLSPTTTETCNTYNMLKLTQHLFEWNPSAETMDYYERALYNHILASQNPQTGMMCYYVPLHSGSAKEFNTPNDSFWCCTGTGVENHAHYGRNIYAHDSGQNLYINLFIASELNWKEQGIAVRQETHFPEQAQTHLTFTCDRPTQMAVHIRHPFWAGAGFRILVNGKAEATRSEPGSYAVVSRTWKSGDTVQIELPMSLRTEGFHDNPNRLAFLYGPIVLCAPTGTRNVTPAIVAADSHPLSKVTPVANRPLNFTGDASLFRIAVTSNEHETLHFTPFYQVADQRYIVYWDLFTPDQWQKQQEEYRVEQERLKDLEARTVDAVHPGEEQNERDHRVTGERTAYGDFNARKWRDARDGGWFSYTLKVLPDMPQDLVCTYWGSDGGGREFDILVNDVKIATQRLENNHPEDFFMVSYPLPPELLKSKDPNQKQLQGKDRITVRFQAHPGRMAGGVFDLKVVKHR